MRRSDSLKQIVSCILLLCATAAFSYASPPDDPIRVKVAVLKNFPPQYSLSETGHPQGFAVDVIEEIAGLANLELEYLVMESWTGMFEALKSGKADLIPNQGITERRKAVFAFSHPVETFPVSVFTRAHNTEISGLQNLAGKKVAVVKLNIGEILVKKRPDLVAQPYDHVENALFSLLSGNTDALIFPEPVLWNIARKARVDDQIRVAGPPLKEILRAVSVIKTNTTLLNRINRAVHTFVGSNAYQRIYTQWYGEPEPFWSAGKVATGLITLLLVVVMAMGFWRYRSTLLLNRELQEVRSDLERQVAARTAELTNTIAELKAGESRLRLQSQIIKQVHDSVISVDMDGIITFWNKGSETLFQYRTAEAMGCHIRMVYPKDAHTRLENKIIPQLLAEGGLEMETTLVRKSGIPFEALVSLSVLRNDDGDINGMIGYTMDISGRKKVEQELARSNKELEQFAYVASHDLQEPLRASVGFLQLLQARYTDRLDEKGTHYIDRAVNAGLRMQNLIRDLLALSRVNTRNAGFEQTDLTQILEEVLEGLHPLLNKSKAVIHRPQLPVCRVDASQIRSLFQNLIANALKYNNSPEPSVHISCRELDAEYLLSVEDNGIGIPKAFHDRIFMIFQRLHTRDEYPGTGIGLALCRKIVERHNGGIWVESEPGSGATFFFTLPREPG